MVNQSHLSLRKSSYQLSIEFCILFPSSSHETSIKSLASYPVPYFLQLGTQISLDDNKKKVTNLLNDCGMVH